MLPEACSGVFRLHLRVAIGALNAFWVVAVGAIALLVTYTVSTRQLEANGGRHVTAIAVAAALSIDQYFGEADEVLRSVQHRALLGTFGSPSEFPPSVEPTALGPVDGGVGVARMIDVTVSIMAEKNFSFFSVNLWFFDGTRVVWRVTTDPRYLSIHADFPVAHDAPLRRNAFGLDVERRRPVDPSAVPAIDALNHSRPIADVRVPPVRTQIRGILGTPVVFMSQARWSPVRFSHPGKPLHQIVGMAPLHNQSRDLLGVVITVASTDRLRELLNTLRSTPGAILAVVNVNGFIVGATEGTLVQHIGPYDGGPVAEGCSPTDDEGSIVSATKRLISCQYHLRDSNEAGLRYLGHNGGLPAAGVQDRIVTNGKRYFVRTEGLKRTALQVRIIVLLPEEDILGDVGRTVLIASVTTAAVVLIVAALSFAFVWRVLRPLVGIAESMAKAARLESDAAGADDSRLVEVGDLQHAFVALRDELDRLRAFVPQSVLTVRRKQPTVDDSTDIETVSRSSRSSQRRLSLSQTHSSEKLHHSRNSSPKCDRESSTPDIHASTIAPPIPDALRTTSVSILCGNLCGYHAATKHSFSPVATAMTVEAVLGAAAQEKGVVDSFHGDRFRISFNAVRPAPNHSVRAALTAVKIKAALDGTAYNLPVTCGVATGPAQVGNAGCAEMKSFTIVGPVVTQAACLERMCKLYEGASCLVPQCLFTELETAVSYEIVDFVELPFVTTPRFVAHVKADPRPDSRGEQWMYQHERPVSDTIARNKQWLALAHNNGPALEASRNGSLRPRDLGLYYDVTALIHGTLRHPSNNTDRPDNPSEPVPPPKVATDSGDKLQDEFSPLEEAPPCHSLALPSPSP